MSFSTLFNISNGSYFDLEPESAWNYGLSITNNFRLFNNSAQLILDYYVTDFENQGIEIKVRVSLKNIS